MSPFALFLKETRASRGFQQNKFAEHLGYEPSYISALERGEKGPPRRDFIDRLVRGLSLSDEEQAKLHEALQTSRRQIAIPRCASDAEFQVAHQLEQQLGKLNPLQIQLIQIALSLSPIAGETHEPVAPAHHREDHIM